MRGFFASGIGLEIGRRLGDNAASMRGKRLRVLGAVVVGLAFTFPFLGQLLVAERRTNEAVAPCEKCLQLWVGPSQQREPVEADLAKLHAHARK